MSTMSSTSSWASAQSSNAERMKCTLCGGTGSMSLFDHRPLGANDDGSRSRAQADGVVHADSFALTIASDTGSPDGIRQADVHTVFRPHHVYHICVSRPRSWPALRAQPGARRQCPPPSRTRASPCLVRCIHADHQKFIRKEGDAAGRSSAGTAEGVGSRAVGKHGVAAAASQTLPLDVTGASI